ncbi:hypothetical protein MJO29_015482 [Puccinia striiformis f. sp. tritici]|nr:hypothetical protein Pst134EB_029756 [Puccinia striiformis f. sp. tritici]KAI7936179.1 hypothetical protein MJO29_015482 [Puccinia striiformis f. sp. tritici]
MSQGPSFRLTGTSFDPVGIIKTVTASILEVFLLCLAGYVLSLKGVIDSKSKNTLNKINVSFFTPALMFSKVAFSLTSEKLADLYVVPLSFVIITLTSCLVAWLLSKLFRLERAERNFCLSFSMFMNSNSLPIALMTSLITTIHGQDGLKWGADDSKDKQLGRSLTYLVVFSTMGLIFRWSYGVKLLSASVGTEDDQQSTHNEGLEEGGTPANEESVPFLNSIDGATPKSSLEAYRPSLEHPSTDQLVSPTQIVPSIAPHQPTKRPSCISFNSIVTSSEAQPSPLIDQSDDHLQVHLQRPIFHSFPNVREYWAQSISSKRNSIATSYTSYNESVVSASETDISVEHHHRRVSHHGNKFSHVMRKTRKLFRLLVVRPALRINQFMSPPLYAAFLSLIVVSLPKLQQYLEDIHPLRSALKSAGNVSVPLTLVVLGAYFNTSDPKQTTTESSTADEGIQSLTPSELKIQAQLRKTRRVERLTILGSILARMIITPLILLPLLFMILRYFHKSNNNPIEIGDPNESGRFHEDPCFILVTVLLIGAPPAITLAQMTNANPFPIGSKAFKVQALQNNKFEKLVSKTLFISYALITPPTTIALVVLGLVIEANR